MSQPIGHVLKISGKCKDDGGDHIWSHMSILHTAHVPTVAYTTHMALGEFVSSIEDYGK